MNKTILIGDFSGIQNYLYNIQKNKGATKRLKGRSTFIELLLGKIRDELCEQLGGEEYLTSGGKFILEVYEFNQEEFNKYKSDIEQKLFDEFYGELKIIFGIGEGDDFKNALNNAYEDVERNKKKAFESVLIKDGKWDEDVFVFNDDRGPDSVDTFTRGTLIDEEYNENSYIKDFIKDELDGEKKGISRQTANDILISNYIAGKKIDTDIKIFDSDKLELNSKIQKHLPMKDANTIKSFEDFVKNKSFNKLAVLKGDIDDLGKIFQFELGDENYKENYKNLSQKLDEFWNEKLYEFIEGIDIYVVYAGGDDFLMLGAWDTIIDFYGRLLGDFQDYIQESGIKKLLKEGTKIHFSAAINLFGPHDTFFTVVKQADSLLDEAKSESSEKNRVNIFGRVIKNDDFENLLVEIEGFGGKFHLLKENSIVSTQTLRFLLDIARKKEIEDLTDTQRKEKNINFFEYGMWKSQLFYMLGRNYKTKDNNHKKDDFRRYIDGMLLQNEVGKFESLSKNNDLLFNDKVGEKLYVMMSYILYKLRG